MAIHDTMAKHKQITSCYSVSQLSESTSYYNFHAAYAATIQGMKHKACKQPPSFYVGTLRFANSLFFLMTP